MKLAEYIDICHSNMKDDYHGSLLAEAFEMAVLTHPCVPFQDLNYCKHQSEIDTTLACLFAHHNCGRTQYC